MNPIAAIIIVANVIKAVVIVAKIIDTIDEI